MFSSQILTGFNVFVSSRSIHSISPNSNSNASSLTTISCCTCLRSQDISVVESQTSDESSSFSSSSSWIKKEDRQKQKDEDTKGISGIRVPRQRYISVSKTKLLESLLSMFESQEQIDEFLRLSSCLDSILHAEHKDILEEMRIDYSLTHSVETKDCKTESSKYSKEDEEKIVVNGKHLGQDNRTGIGSMEIHGKEEKDEDDDDDDDDDGRQLNFNGIDLRFLLGPSVKNAESKSASASRVAVATRFQRAFMKLLHNAQFEELSARDLFLTSVLNTDYLLTLPIYVDWKKASESNAIIFRRGYATERQNGLLIGEKLDYLQSKLLQGIFFTLSKPLGKVGKYINEALRSASQAQEVQVWIERVKHWFKELPLSEQYSVHERTFDNQLVADELSDTDLPIWLAAQRAVPRYEGLLSSIGPRGRLLRKLLTWIGIIPSVPETSFELDGDSTTSEPYLRPIFLSRISLGDIWKPATREQCGNVWNMLKTVVSILFSQSALQDFDVREYAIALAGRLSENNPAYVLRHFVAILYNC